jgi:hypothetical protein
MPILMPVPVPMPMPSIRPRPPTTRTHAQAPRCAALVAALRRPQPVRRQRLHGLQWAPGLGHIGPRTGHNGQVHPVLIGMLREHLESKGEVLEGERTLPV